MRKLFNSICVLFVFTIPQFLFAGVSAFTGTSGEKLFIEEAANLGKDVFLVKFEGVNSDWNGKVIQTKKTVAASGERYGFDYVLELSNGKHPRHYEMLVELEKTLVKGTLVRQFQLFSGLGKSKVTLSWNEELTNASQKIDLLKTFKKSPFVPEVE